MFSSSPNPENANLYRAQRLRRTARAVRSGFRRYPRAILESFSQSAFSGDPPDLPELLEKLSPHDLAVLWLGHASIVVQMHEITICVDPVLSDRIGMRLKNRTIGIKRLTPPPMHAESLQGAELLLITHAHFDHLDKPTLERMCSNSTTVIVPTRCAKLIPDGFERVIELKAGSQIQFHDLLISAIQPKHWGARSLFDRKRGVNSYLIESSTQSILLTGDTADTKAYEGINPVDIAVFGIGAYDPWDHMHATPEQAWRMFQGINAKYLLPIHHSTFELSDEPAGEPLRRLKLIAGDDIDAILEPHIGEVIVVYTPELSSDS